MGMNFTHQDIEHFEVAGYLWAPSVQSENAQAFRRGVCSQVIPETGNSYRSPSRILNFLNGNSWMSCQQAEMRRTRLCAVVGPLRGNVRL